MKRQLALLALLLVAQLAWGQNSHTDRLMGYTITLPDDWQKEILDSVNETKYTMWVNYYDTKPSYKDDNSIPPPPPPPPPPGISTTDPGYHSPTSVKPILYDEIFTDMVRFNKQGSGILTIGSQRGNPIENTFKEYQQNFLEGIKEVLIDGGLEPKIDKPKTERIGGKTFIAYYYTITNSADNTELATGVIYFYNKVNIVWTASLTFVSKEGKKIQEDALRNAIDTFN